VFPVVLLFIELPNAEVDANVHPSKTEVRFRQQSLVHDFVRDSVRAALMKARPVPQFTREITAQPTAAPGLSPGAALPFRPETQPRSTGGGTAVEQAAAADEFPLQAPPQPVINSRLQFAGEPIPVDANSAISGFGAVQPPMMQPVVNGGRDTCGNILADEPQAIADESALASLKPVGQVRESFILAVNADGLWIIDQHVAHERVLFEKILRERTHAAVEGQHMLMPLIVELTPGQQAVFADISEELRRNGFDVELFGTRTVAVKTAPAGVQAGDVEKMLIELLDQFQHEEQLLNLDKIRARIAASIACHAAIKINMPLDQQKMEWLLKELAKTECPMSCPHGRPIVLRYSVKEIQKAFKRI
jgi:DNA mismatch repair protein MutL